MEASDVWCTVTDDQVGLLATKDSVDGSHGLLCGNVTLEDGNSIDGCHFLQIHGHYFDLARC